MIVVVVATELAVGVSPSRSYWRSLLRDASGDAQPRPMRLLEDVETVLMEVVALSVSLYLFLRLVFWER